MRYLLFIFLVWFVSCESNSEKIQPQERPITESVYASVTIQPDSLYQAHAIVSGILEVNIIEEGDMVKRGEAIVQIINNAPKLNTQNAKLALDLAEQNFRGSAAILNSIRDEIAAAELRYSNDSVNYFRQANLWKQQIGSKAEYDSRKLNFQLSRNTLLQLKNKYDQTERELKTALEQARNNYETSLIATKDYTVQSKINGKVYALYKEPGEIVSTMEPIAAIGSADKFVIEMLVDEVDIVSVKIDQKVLITLDAYNDTVFEAKVSKIYPKKDERNQTFLIEALFNEAPTTLYPGLSGEANIIIDQRENALTIPKSFLIDGNKVQGEDGTISVSTGISNMEYVEIVSGITKDTYIYKPD